MDHVPGAHDAGYPVGVAYSARMAYGAVAWWDKREGEGRKQMRQEGRTFQTGASRKIKDTDRSRKGRSSDYRLY
jgi:hypothetical protein